MKKFKSIYIEITKACNLSCRFCPSSSVNTHEYLSLDNFKYIVDQVKDYTEGIYLHILGEPLLHKDLFKFIEYASRYVKVSITTNGRLIKKFIDQLIESNLYVLNISLQSLIKEDVDIIDEYLLQIKNLLDNKKDKMAVHLRMWNDKEVNLELNNYLINYFNQLDLNNYHNVNLSVQDEFKWPDLNDNNNLVKSSCLGGKSQMGILLNGDVVICCLDYLGKTCISNIYKNSFVDIINSDLFTKVIKGWNDLNPYFDLCKKCTFRNRFKKGAKDEG